MYRLLPILALLVLLMLASQSGCATTISPRDIPDPKIDLKKPWEYAGLCQMPVYVVSDVEGGDELEAIAKETVEYWNCALAQNALEYAGQTEIDTSQRTAPYITISAAPLYVLDVWAERAEKRRLLKCEESPQNCKKTPAKILGTALPHMVDRRGGEFVYVHGFTADIVSNVGPTRFCSVGGRVLYRDDEEYSYLRTGVVIHEVGHLLGLTDIDDGNGIMGATIGWDTALFRLFDAKTKAELEYLYGDVGAVW